MGTHPTEIPITHKVKIDSGSHGRHINSLLTEKLLNLFKISSILEPNAVMRNVIGYHLNVNDNLTTNYFFNYYWWY